MTPPVSIVIPTRNRVECALSCIAAALEATQQSEIVVADSGDDDALRRAVEQLNFDTTRVRYLKTPASWTVVENFEGALEHCHGDFVIYLGDDDLVGPHVEDICRWATANGIDAIVGHGHRFGAAYYWPGVTSKYFRGGYASRLFVWSHTSKVVRLDPRAQIEAAKNNVGKGLCLLPRIYHGLVDRRLLHRVRERHGRVFGGVSPDIFSAILIADESRNAVFLDYPFCVPGASPKSQAGSGTARTDRGDFEESPYLSRFQNLAWDDSIPRFFSPFTVWGYSMKEALKCIGDDDDSRWLGHLYARCLLYCWSHRERVFDSLAHSIRRQGVTKPLWQLALGIAFELGTLFTRILAKLLLPRAGGWSARYSGLPDSLAAYRFLRDKVPPPKLRPL